ncbi:MAG: T9SS type A sorting domain-containing protein [Cyclobacteriaceae bacterium]
MNIKFLPFCLLISTLSAVGQVNHSIAVSFEQGEECAVVAGLEGHQYFSIYPNPTLDYININSELIDAEISLINLQGKVFSNSKSISSKLRIDVRGLPKGLYILQYKASNQIQKLKVFIK